MPGSRLLRSLLRPVFLVRAFTTCWRSNALHSGVEVVFAGTGTSSPLSVFCLRTSLVIGGLYPRIEIGLDLKDLDILQGS